MGHEALGLKGHVDVRRRLRAAELPLMRGKACRDWVCICVAFGCVLYVFVFILCFVVIFRFICGGLRLYGFGLSLFCSYWWFLLEHV